MQHHILGVGSVGTLLGFHLRRTIRKLASTKDAQKALQGLPSPHAHPFLPPPSHSGVTLHLRPSGLRQPSSATAGRAKGKAKALDGEAQLLVESGGVKQIEEGFHVERTDAATDLVRGVLASGSKRRGSASPREQQQQQQHLTLGTDIPDPSPTRAIDSLIISTKADSVLSALRSISGRITPETTIVLATNGALGVLQELNHRIFRDPSKRPFFLLANNTHGTWSKAPRQTVHAAQGELQLALVPDPVKMAAEGSMTTWERAWGGGLAAGATVGRDQPLASAAVGRGGSNLLDLDALPSNASIRGTLASLLVLPLGVSWVSWSEMKLLQRRKLVVNACINPLTALLDVRNGALFGRREADALLRSICAEAEAVFAAETLLEAEQLAQGPSTTTGTGTLHPSLRSNALYAEVQRVMQSTSPNWSSMHQDMHRRLPSSRSGSAGGGAGVAAAAAASTGLGGARRTEIDHLNGSICDMGRRLGVPTPVNETLVGLVKTKAAIVDTGAKAWGIA